MTAVQVQDPVVPQAWKVLLRQERPLQHAVPALQVWPMPVQVDAWQVPAVWPVGITQEVAAQQSAVPVHTAPCG